MLKNPPDCGFRDIRSDGVQGVELALGRRDLTVTILHGNMDYGIHEPSCVLGDATAMLYHGYQAVANKEPCCAAFVLVPDWCRHLNLSEHRWKGTRREEMTSTDDENPRFKVADDWSPGVRSSEICYLTQ